MRWVIAKNTRCDIRTYSAPNLCGRSEYVQIFPSGRQGRLTTPFQSFSFAGPIGTRLVISRSMIEEDWELLPWRAILIQKPNCYRTKDGRLAVNIPHLELMDKANAKRTNHAYEESYPFAESLDEGSGWTYGRIGTLLEQVNTIRIDRV